MLASWILFPAVAVAVGLGHGLLVERVSGRRLPGVLLVPLGVAGFTAVSQVTTWWSWSTWATTPLVVLVALAGYAVGHRRLRAARLDGWALAAALGAFAVFAAPIVLSGDATFAGYTVLGDTAIHFIGADALPRHGHDFASLAPSSYRSALEGYYGASGYPSGGPTGIGALRPLTGQDVAWVFQPYLALLVAMLALTLYVLAGSIVRRAPLRALVAFVAAQPTLVFGYALQGSVKEIGMAFCVPLLCAGAAVAARAPARASEAARQALPLAVAAAAAVAFVGLSAAVWIVPLALGTLVVLARHSDGARAPVAAATSFAGVLVVLGLPAWLGLRGYLDVTAGVVTTNTEFGNLFHPLLTRQAGGIWLAGDYRTIDLVHRRPTNLLIAVEVVALALGLVAVARRRVAPIAAYAAISLLAWLYIKHAGSPWAIGKVLTISSPAVVFLAMIGAATAIESRVGRVRRMRQVLAAGLAIVVGGAVIVSNGFAYGQTSLAPRARFDELAAIGRAYAGQGPLLDPEFEQFAKHFLRSDAVDLPAEPWQVREPVRADGALARRVPFPGGGGEIDVDAFDLRYVERFRTIVVRTGPLGSRPPSNYGRVRHGRFYDVWQRRADLAQERILLHIGLGGARTASGTISCQTLRALGWLAAAADGRLAYVPRPQVPRVIPALGWHPHYWTGDPADAFILHPQKAGRVTRIVDLPRGGRYGLWLEGSFGREVRIAIDGRSAGAVANRIDGRRVTELVGVANLAAGRHHIVFEVGGPTLAPGEHGANRRLGPLYLAPTDPARALGVRSVRPSQWPQICGRALDWVEVTTSAGERGGAQPTPVVRR